MNCSSSVESDVNETWGKLEPTRVESMGEQLKQGFVNYIVVVVVYQEPIQYASDTECATKQE